MFDSTLPPDRHSPEQRLMQAVLWRAFQDLFTEAKVQNQDLVLARNDSFAFFTSPSGTWAQSRRDICHMAGVDPDALRRRIIMLLEGDDLHMDGEGLELLKSHLPHARELWEKHKALQRPTPPKPDPTPPKPPKPRNKTTKYSDVLPIVHKLLDQPRTFKDLIIATNGDVSDAKIREVLRRGLAAGRLIQDDRHRYTLAPETAVVAATG
ncbi:hypothetical protein ACERZ8_17330 [Tateyamaria armeniaca]|uniref:DUF2285 domain-containing protein n=1 Tax=Tateyamaria armeniaca TaxID=2518930 RepID=A0ABW8UWL6_9RHOB